MRCPARSPFHRPAIQTLERLHSELGGQILENKTEALKLTDSMRHVEAVIKMLDPTSCGIMAMTPKWASWEQVVMLVLLACV